jgi:uncharacterized protein (TIGR02217 family)
MSNLVFPSTMNGYLWDSKKKPVFNNLTHSSATGRDVRIALYDQPVYEFTLSNQWLTRADKDTLIGFFVARRGMFDSWLYLDEDGVVTAQTFGTGDGVATAFQLLKATVNALEIVNNLVSSPLIYINGVLKTIGTHYSVSATGLITFVTVPTAGAVLAWTGSAYYRCVFLEDTLAYNQFASRLYDCSEIKFKGSLVNKL